LTVELLAALKAKQIAPRYRFTVRSGEADYGGLARRVVDADSRCVLVIGDARDSATLVRALRAAGSASRLFGGPAMGRHRFRELAGAAADDVVFPQLYVAPADAPAGFDYAAAHTYDAVRLLIAAIRRAGLNRAAICDALRELSPTAGITGPIRWDNLGSNTRRVTLNLEGPVGEKNE
jgi:ABC-type branched-subunit amino acid transport system substrate-binding protein